MVDVMFYTNFVIIALVLSVFCEKDFLPETSQNYWLQEGQQSVLATLQKKYNTAKAKNVIIFLGDGMSIPTIAAARTVLEEQNENLSLSFEQFPHVGLSKTYCIDKQVADSACSATAYLTGVKANYGTIGVDGNVKRKNCTAMNFEEFHTKSIAQWAQEAGKKTGVVTTARITDASPAGLYAHTAERDWSNDVDVQKSGLNPNICKDIAQQLIYNNVSQNFNLILGGGLADFLPENYTINNVTGVRKDGQNLVQTWLDLKKQKNHNGSFVYDLDGLSNVTEDTQFILGLFDSGNMKYNLDRDVTKQPSLEEMTAFAINYLSNLTHPNEGYFLFIEGALIDKAHHLTQARKALDEVIEFSKAVQKATDLTDSEDTLIIVTADHAHTMSFGAGYPKRGMDILGMGGIAQDGVGFSFLNYANGPSYKEPIDNRRYDISKDDMSDKNYKYPSLYPSKRESHGGDDVAIYAKGPWSHLFSGVHEQNVIPLLAGFASCIGSGHTLCDNPFRKE